MLEEAAIAAPAVSWITLDTRGSVPAKVFRDWRSWGPNVFVVHKHSFGVELSGGDQIQLSAEHTEWRWLDFETASQLTRYDSDRTALWEFNERLKRLDGPDEQLARGSL